MTPDEQKIRETLEQLGFEFKLNSEARTLELLGLRIPVITNRVNIVLHNSSELVAYQVVYYSDHNAWFVYIYDHDTGGFKYHCSTISLMNAYEFCYVHYRRLKQSKSN